MCGIVSYVGEEPKATRLLLQGLKSLEYRGYDSSGIALLNDTLSVYKNKGKIIAEIFRRTKLKLKKCNNLKKLVQ